MLTILFTLTPIIPSMAALSIHKTKQENLVEKSVRNEFYYAAYYCFINVSV